MRYRLYIDESGDHTSTHVTDVGKRYLGLVGVMLEQQNYYQEFAKDMEVFKKTYLTFDADHVPVLHREDILNKRGVYSCLLDPDRKDLFDQSLLQMIEAADFKIIAVVLDKHTHKQATYRKLRHPYHYCLLAMMERYCGLLERTNSIGDVMAEARGSNEDMLLKSVYGDLWARGKMYLNASVCQKTLTSKELKVKPKRANIAGLQLADLLAHPLTRDVLQAYRRAPPPTGEFTTRICEISKSKYNRQIYQGRINGYGRVILS